jgi:pyridoxine 4-dehydrogenase
MRHHMTRFKDDEIMQYNFAIVDKIKTVAEKKGVTPAQLCLAWVSSLSPVMLPIPGSSYVVRSRVKLLADLFFTCRKSTRTLENLQAGDVVLSADELKAVTEAVESHEVRGDRYGGQTEKEAHLWQ